MRKILFLLYIALFTCTQVCADEVSFVASAPDAVAIGDQFRLSYTISTQKVRDFRAPVFKGFENLSGPNRSTQSSMQMINGKTTSTSSITFTYILLANTEGEFNIAPATVTADGKQVSSNSLTIKVLPADKANGLSGNNSKSSQIGGKEQGNSSVQVSGNDLFVIGSASKTTVYEQEAFLLTYKIYSAVELRGFDNVKLPDFKGFQSQEVDLPDRKWSLEHYKDRNYRTTIYRQFVLFPQQTGKLTIEQARFDASIAKATKVSDPFEAFFNGGNSYVEVKKTLLTPQITINVQELPAGKPAGFSGGVGDFNISSSINSTKVKTNDAITLKLVISGTGNLKLVNTPEVKFPDDFEIYDPKTENKFRLTSAGLTGNQVIEYLAIPRNAGTFKIPPVKFSYFDIKSHTYKTLTTEEYEIMVEKGSGDATQTIANFTNKEDLKVLNEDIRFIKQKSVKLTPRGSYFYGSASYWLFLLIPLLVFVACFVLYRQRISENANVVKVRTKKANKVAVKRLKQAGKLLQTNQKDAFYDEVLRALWGYISDKLSIPVSKLSKDNIEEELRNHGVSDELTHDFIESLNNCEFARFAPGSDNQAMDKVYNNALDIISKMENSIKN